MTGKLEAAMDAAMSTKEKQRRRKEQYSAPDVPGIFSNGPDYDDIIEGWEPTVRKPSSPKFMFSDIDIALGRGMTPIDEPKSTQEKLTGDAGMDRKVEGGSSEGRCEDTFGSMVWPHEERPWKLACA